MRISQSPMHWNSHLSNLLKARHHGIIWEFNISYLDIFWNKKLCFEHIDFLASDMVLNLLLKVCVYYEHV